MLFRLFIVLTIVKESCLNYLVQKTDPTHCRIYIGGSFDPVHMGHIGMATAIDQAMQNHADINANLKTSIYFLPTAGSPFKNTQTTTADRLAMLDATITDIKPTFNSHLSVDKTEIHNTPPVFTIDTLMTLKAKFPQDVVIFVMGLDSLKSLPKWKQGLDLVAYAHLWVFNRIEANLKQDNHSYETLDNMCQHLPLPLVKHRVNRLAVLLNQPNGGIFLDVTSPPTIASSEIRSLIYQEKGFSTLVTTSVAKYIKKHQLYRK